MPPPSSVGDLASCRLLKFLREGLLASDGGDATSYPTFKEEKERKVSLILEFESEFPSKLRKVISQTPSEEPSAFLNEIYKAAKALFFGLSYQPDNDENRANELHPTEEIEDSQDDQSSPPFHWWHGLNSDFDTEEQVEVVIHLFPTILSEKQKASPLSSLNNTYPIYAQLFCSKSLPFIPLFAELGTELRLFKDQERAGLFCFMKNVVFHLINNNLLKDKKKDINYEELDTVYTQILRRLKNSNLLYSSDIYNLDLVPVMVYRSMYNPVIQTDQRLSFLIEWDPSLLIACGRNRNLLNAYLNKLHSFVILPYPSRSREVRTRDFQRFRLLLQLEMAHYHESLGFIFHDDSLDVACKIFGSQKVTQVIDDELRRILVNNSSNGSNDNTLLRSLVITACTDEQISLDGLYTLLRHDPIAVLPNKT